MATAMHRAKHHAFAVLFALTGCLDSGLASGLATNPDPAGAQLTALTPSFDALTRPVRPSEDALVAAESPSREAQSAQCAAVEALDVLLIGNSYVLHSDTPGLLKAMAEDAGVAFHVEHLATGGKNFEYHLARSRTRAMLAERDWDVVLLQSHSLDPLRNPKGFATAGAALVDMVREVGAEPLLFETWPRREGHNLYNYMEEVGKSPDEMLERVSAGYAALGAQTGAAVVPVGHAWMHLHDHHPEVQPYLKDGAHPAEAGAYLSAAVIFTQLTDRDPRGVLQPHGAVDAATASALQDVVVDVVSPPCAW